MLTGERVCDLTGQRFGRLLVVARRGSNRWGNALWLCRCDCGGEVVVAGAGLRRHVRPTRSCGCLVRELLVARSVKHGHSPDDRPTPTYNSYRAMVARCTDPTHPYWHRYGGRGITIDPRWLGEHGFQNFLADMGERPRGKTLDRFPDSDDGYSKRNCRWATPSEQARNRSRRAA